MKKLQDNLFGAIKTGNKDIIKTLLKEVDVNFQSPYKDFEGITPLHYAVILEKNNIVHSLLEAGANPNLQSQVKNFEGMTPLHYAVLLDLTEIEKRLISNSQTNQEIKNKKGETPKDLRIKRVLSCGPNKSKIDYYRKKATELGSAATNACKNTLSTGKTLTDECLKHLKEETAPSLVSLAETAKTYGSQLLRGGAYAYNWVTKKGASGYNWTLEKAKQYYSSPQKIDPNEFELKDMELTK